MSEDLTLLPCPDPECRGEAKIYLCHTGKEVIHCTRCSVNVFSPAGYREWLVGIWNSLPRALSWTKEAPQVAGHYWWACDKYTTTGPQVACIKVGTNHMRSGLHMRFVDCGPTYHHCDKCRWAGPIPMPKEPTP